MSTYTAGSWDEYELEDYQSSGYQDTGSQQSWNIQNSSAGFSGTGYVEAFGGSTSGVSGSSAIIHYSITAPNTTSSVWVWAKGGVFAVIYANDPQIDLLTATASWGWLKVPTSLVNQSQVQIISQDQGVCVDKIIITQVSETPADTEGFTNTQTGGGSSGSGNTSSNNSSGVCSGTETTRCFNCYEAENANWLEPGSNGAKWVVDSTSGSGASGSLLASTEDTPANNTSLAAKAHIPIVPTQTNNWSTWFRVKGQGTFIHVWADNFGVHPIIVSSTEWDWVKSTAPHDAFAAKIKLLSQDKEVSVDKIAMIDGDEIPTGSNGFCLGNGSGSNGNSGGSSTEGQTSHLYNYLPENLTCIVTVIPPEVTNR